MNKKELISFIKENRNGPKAALYYSPCLPRDKTKFLRLEGKNEGLIVCVGTERKARVFLKNILFDMINLPEDFDIILIKKLISKNYFADFDCSKKEWMLYCRPEEREFF